MFYFIKLVNTQSKFQIAISEEKYKKIKPQMN